MTIESRFISLEWRDAALLGLAVERTNPGANDEVVLSVKWQARMRMDQDVPLYT